MRHWSGCWAAVTAGFSVTTSIAWLARSVSLSLTRLVRVHVYRGNLAGRAATRPSPHRYVLAERCQLGLPTGKRYTCSMYLLLMIATWWHVLCQRR